MQDYCIQDTAVTLKLYKELQKAIQEGIIPESAIEMEHEFAKLIHWQEQEGVPFDTEAAIKLRDPLKQRIEEVRQELIRIVPPTIIKLKTKTKTVPFNPGSRDQILKFLQDKYDWKPEKRTKGGNASLDEEVLSGLTYPEAPLFLEYFSLQKLLGMLSEGKESWLNHVKDGRIHGKVNTAGTITGRSSHVSPNLGQIPSTRSFMGKEVRSLFYAPEGMSLVGIDASGLELRCLAHYLDHWDYGQYTQVVCEGDVHTTNMLAAGLPNRDSAKTFIYALLYGAGDEKIGSIVLPDGTKDRKKDAGLVLRTRFMQQLPAYGALVKKINEQVDTKGYLVGIDGRRLTIRHRHAALNTLLQNAGAVACKTAWVILFEKLRAQGIKAYPALNVHDEAQILVASEHASEVGRLGVASIQEAGIKLGFKCPLTGAYRIGRNWSETH
jgi:DNA polymerase I-like protein with 3'-5' exonuclease and polymerase domains